MFRELFIDAAKVLGVMLEGFRVEIPRLFEVDKGIHGRWPKGAANLSARGFLRGFSDALV